MNLSLGSDAFKSLSVGASRWWASSKSVATGEFSTPKTPGRCELRGIFGGVRAVLFDFDGTLTATPGDRAERRLKIAELQERSALLEPWLKRLRAADLRLGIMSKSSEGTILAALRAAGLRELFDGPVVAKALGLEGKAGLIRDLCARGGAIAALLGPAGCALSDVLLIDDDVKELMRARELNIQTYPAPETGGLQDEDFFNIFEDLKLECPARPMDSGEVSRLCSLGLVGREEQHLDATPTQADVRLRFTDHYEVRGELEGIDEGSFGACSPGVHIKTGKKCAIKFISKQGVGRHYIRNFIENDEYTFLLRMGLQEPHQNVVRQLDYLIGPKTIYNAMELLEGQDLFTYLQEHAPVSEEFVAAAMRQLLEALRHVHGALGRGLIHRDVKLENLRFRHCDPDSDLVLLDFGLSCPASPDEKRGVVGTLTYMAPEIFSGSYSPKVDLWSAGVLLYITLAGRPPWSPDPDAGISLQKQVQDGSALREALQASELSSAPPQAVDFLRTLLVMAPSQRATAAMALEHPWLLGAAGFRRLRPAALELQDGQMQMLGVKADAYKAAFMSAAASPKARLGVLLAEDCPENDGPQDLCGEAPVTPRQKRGWFACCST